MLPASTKTSDLFQLRPGRQLRLREGSGSLTRGTPKEGVKHEYHAYPGDHSLTYFLSHFAEVMEFHSEASDCCRSTEVLSPVVN